MLRAAVLSVVLGLSALLASSAFSHRLAPLTFSGTVDYAEIDHGQTQGATTTGVVGKGSFTLTLAAGQATTVKLPPLPTKKTAKSKKKPKPKPRVLSFRLLTKGTLSCATTSTPAATSRASFSPISRRRASERSA